MLIEVAQHRFLVRPLIPEHMVDDDKDAMPDRDDRFLLAPPRDQPAIVPRAASVSARRSYLLPRRVLPLVRFPALSWFPGHIPHPTLVRRGR